MSNEIIIKGKKGTEFGPKHLKSQMLYDNLKNLSNYIEIGFNYSYK